MQCNVLEIFFTKYFLQNLGGNQKFDIIHSKTCFQYGRGQIQKRRDQVQHRNKG